MNDLRTAAQQALEAWQSHQHGKCPLEKVVERITALKAALAQEQDAELSAALGWPGGISNPVLDRTQLLQMVAALRVSAQQARQALEGWDNYGKWVWPESALEQAKRNTTEALATLRAALAQEQDDDWTRCHHCGQTMPPVPLGQEQAEPVQEPVAWHYTNNAGASVWHRRPSNRLDADMQAARDYPHAHKVTPLYLAPPKKRTMVPLTEGEIMGAFHAARNAKLGASQDNSRHRLSVVEIARAIEKASWEKNHG